MRMMLSAVKDLNIKQRSFNHQLQLTEVRFLFIFGTSFSCAESNDTMVHIFIWFMKQGRLEILCLCKLILIASYSRH